MYDIYKHKSIWLDADTRRSLADAREAALFAYNALSDMNSSSNPPRAFFNMIPKYHVVDHLLRDAIVQGMSPRVYWTLGDESWGGELAKVCAQLHPQSMSERAVQRWLAVFFQEARDF